MRYSSDCIVTSRRRDESKKLLKRRRKNGSSTYLYCDVADSHSNEMRHFLISLDERKREREMNPPPSGAWRIKINVNTAYSPVSYVYFRSALVSVNFISFYFIFSTGGKKESIV